jgi:hypothetical protein
VKENPSQPGAKHKGCYHSRKGYGDRALQASLHDIHAKFHSHDEHVESQAELRCREEVALSVARFLRGVPRKQPLLRRRPKQAKKGWAKHYACDHFRHHLRLSETCRDRSNNSAKDQDNGKLEKKLNGQIEVLHERDVWSDERILRRK